MKRKRKEKIVYAELKRTPVGTLFLSATGRGVASVALGSRSEKEFIERERKRFGREAIFLKAGSIEWHPESDPGKRTSLAIPHFAGSESEETGTQCSILNDALKQLIRYFSGQLRRFSVRKDFSGLTHFEQNVLRQLEHVAFGTTASYGELAKKVNNPKGARAVGNAVGKNPLAVIVPCHRVIKGDGSIGGFGAPISIKKKLLSHEQ